MSIETVNEQMRAAWGGEEGQRWVEWAEAYEATSVRHTARLLETAAISTNEDVLDVGCGTGALTLAAARLAAPGKAIGVDVSGPMLGRARRRAQDAGLPNAAFEHADAQIHRFEPKSFDVAVSSFGIMFFDNPVAAFTNIRWALRPGGRLAALAWRSFRQNPWLVSLYDALLIGRKPERTPPSGVPGPFGLADPRFVRRTLTLAGFTALGLKKVDDAVYLGPDADSAYHFIANGFGLTKGMLTNLDSEGQGRALDAVRAVVEAAGTRDGVWMESAAWLITARR